MEGLADAGQACVASILKHCLSTGHAQEECLKLGRGATRLALILAELQLCMRANEALRGSKTVFLAVDAAVSALRQAEQLVAQCAGTSPSSIWPLEDAVEFQAVAAELRSAAGGLAALGGRLPPDVQRDASHVYQQFVALGFTEDELSETEEQELERVQHHNSTASPRHPAATAAAAPPAAPADQFVCPEDAMSSGAVAASERAAARARAPAAPGSAEEAEERRAVAGAAAVAHEAAAEVLSAGGDEEEEEEASASGGGEAGEEELALQAEIRAEAAEEAAAAAGPVVLTPEGETALSPEAPAKGAVPSRGASPLPPDPFAMTTEEGNNTLRELRSFQQGQENLAVADEAQRQLEASADCLSLKEQQAQRAGSQELQTLAALKQLQEYEAAMEAGEEAEAAEEGGGEPEAGCEAEGEAAAAAPAPAPVVHKSGSQQASAFFEHNLAELASEFPTAAASMEGGGGGSGGIRAAAGGEVAVAEAVATVVAQPAGAQEE